MKNAPRITQSSDKDGMDAASRKLWKKDANGNLIRRDDKPGKYADLRPSRYSNPNTMADKDVNPMPGKQAVVEGAPQNVPGEKYSGRKLPKASEVVQAVEDDSALARARRAAKKAER
jgi:hypothetical protein